MPSVINPKVFEYYDILSNGVIISKRRGKVISTCLKRTGYLQAVLNVDGKKLSFLVHRLVALKFLPQIEGHDCVNHIDGNRSNNLLSNLEWCTDQQNSQRKVGKNSLSEGDEVKIRELYSSGSTQTYLASLYDVNQSHISRIVNFKSRK